MKKESLIALAIFMAVWAVSHADALNTGQVSPISEKTRTSWNRTFTLDEAHKKCAEYLRTTLAEFLQKVNKTANNVSEYKQVPLFSQGLTEFNFFN